VHEDNQPRDFGISPIVCTLHHFPRKPESRWENGQKIKQVGVFSTRLFSNQTYDRCDNIAIRIYVVQRKAWNITDPFYELKEKT